MGDLTSPRLIDFKGLLFLLGAAVAATGLLSLARYLLAPPRKAPPGPDAADRRP